MGEVQLDKDLPVKHTGSVVISLVILANWRIHSSMPHVQPLLSAPVTPSGWLECAVTMAGRRGGGIRIDIQQEQSSRG